jgi:hypothetical protein
MAIAGSLVAPTKWSDLPADKQRILAPLSAEWPHLEWWRRKKWLEIANRYPTMTRPEQERVQQRMQAWVRLTPEERKAAREKYRNIQKASSEQREAVKQLWSEYEMLPDQEKQRLRDTAGKAPPSRAPRTVTPAVPAKPGQ